MGAIHTKIYFDRMTKIFGSCTLRYRFETNNVVLVRKNKPIAYYKLAGVNWFVWNADSITEKNILIADYKETHLISFRKASLRAFFQCFGMPVSNCISSGAYNETFQ